jgi:Lysozyme like domain
VRSGQLGGRAGGIATALRSLEGKWTSGRRALVPAGVIAVVIAVATSALVASGDEAPAKGSAARPPARPNYLLPMGALLRDGSFPAPALSGDRGKTGVPAGTPAPPTAADPVSAEQVAAIAPYRGSDGTLTPAGIATLALQSGCSPAAAVTATAIAMAESGGSPSAQGDVGLMTSVWDWSAGLWQIRGLRAERNTGQLRDSIANQAVEHNAAAMQTISNGCSDWTPWSTFTNGAYQRFTTLAQQAVRYVVAYYNAHGHHYPAVPAPDPNATIPSAGGPGGGGGAAAQAGGAATTARRTTSPKQGAQHSATPNRSAAAHPGSTTTAAAPAPTSSRPPTTVKKTVLPLPLPTTLLPSKSTLPKLPLPTVSLQPLPTLPHLP